MADIYIGVLSATLVVPGSRTLKQRRQAVRSLKDRVRSRFGVTFNELGGEHPGQQGIVCTTGGNDGARVREVMDSVADFIRGAPDAYAGTIDVDVFGWHPEAQWADDLLEDEEFGDG